MKKLRLYLFSMALVSVMVLSACATPKAPAPAPAPTPVGPAATPAPAGPTATSREQLLAAANKEGEVAVWSNTFDKADEVLKPFYDKYPGIKVKLWDASTGNDAINKLVEEGKAGRVTGDIFFSGEGDLVNAVATGVMQEYDWKTAGWPNQPSHKFYANYATNPRLPAFNTNVIPVDQGPKSWEDLATNKWASKSPVASFSGAEGPLLFAYMWREKEGVLNWEKAEKYWIDVVKNNKPKVVRGFSGPIELMIAGEYGIFVPVASGGEILNYALKGAPIAIVPIGKTPGITQSLGIVKNPAHPNAAKVFADWFTAEGGQFNKLNTDMRYAIAPDMAKVARANILLRDKYQIAVEPVPSEFFTPANVKRANDFHLKTLGVN
ncbi:MAG: transporter substrate-binding protein [Dehalococcoidia bacterium]|nr:transporter substrate-binding protein [Dehalococcoidia bacterium]